MIKQEIVIFFYEACFQHCMMLIRDHFICSQVYTHKTTSEPPD